MNQAEHDLLVLRAQDGSRIALEALVRLHQRDLVRFAHSLCREPALAQDAVQDAWLKVMRRLRDLDDPRVFRAWLFRATRWRVLDLLKRAERRTEPLDRLPPESPETVDSRDGAIDLARALDQLSPKVREQLHLFYVSGLTVAEIAVVQDLPPGTVKSRLHRAREQLKRQLGDREDES